MVYDLPLGGRRLIQTSSCYLARVKSGEVVYEAGEATGVLPGKLIRGKQTCEVKTEKERVPFIDRTLRLMSVKAFKLLWNFRKSSVKTTVVSDD